MKNPKKRYVYFLVIFAVLVLGNVSAQAQAAPHQVNLKAMKVNRGTEHRYYPQFTNPANLLLKVRRNNSVRFNFTGMPRADVTIRSEVKIDRDSTEAGPPYSYDGKKGIKVNPEDGVYQIKYDVIVTNADQEYEPLDPIIIVDDLGGL